MSYTAAAIEDGPDEWTEGCISYKRNVITSKFKTWIHMGNLNLGQDLANKRN